MSCAPTEERAQRTAQLAGGYGLIERTRVTKGILATTTRFTPGAYAEAAELGHRLTLRDRDAIAAWVRKSGIL
jgi:hypothetical protein